ncbi:MAG: transporter related [Frankiales bacterium]|nr:transporter related [Frankiales bacterium]
MTAPVVTAALELRGVNAGYGRVQVLYDINLVLPPRGVVALLGPNGAGKSTLLRVASGRTVPSSGQVLLRGNDVTGRSPERLARVGLCSVPEGRGVFPNLTVSDNLRMWTFRPGVRRKDVEETAYGRFPRLAERRRQLAGRLSGGEQQMLAMSRALTADPDVLLLDEISMGLAPVVVAELFALVRQIADDGTPVLLVEQFARTALEVADEVAVLSQGRIRLHGAPDQVRDGVLATYLHAEGSA